MIRAGTLERLVGGSWRVAQPFNKAVHIVLHACERGVQLVFCSTIGTGTEMAGGTGLDAVATDLHVPEQSLAKLNGRLSVSHVKVQVRRQRNSAVLLHCEP